MIDKKTLKKTFGAPLSADGYVRKGQSWYKSGTGVTVVVNLQKSDFAEKYYVNIAFLIQSLTDETYLPEYKCHIMLRAGWLHAEAPRILEQCFRLDNDDLDAIEQASCVGAFVRDVIMPFCGRLLSLEELMETYLSGGFSRALVRREAVEFFRKASIN